MLRSGVVLKDNALIGLSSRLFVPPGTDAIRS